MEKLWNGDCVEVMGRMAAESIDAVVCDPPYGLAFMGKAFDKLGDGPAQQAWHIRWLEQAYRVLRPGGYLLAFGGTRTYHRLACAVEDVGFEVRDSLHWVQAQGFPKSHDVSKAIDKMAGAEREAICLSMRHGGGTLSGAGWNIPTAIPTITAPATDDARKWNGWGTALKPAHEPIVVARKPFPGTLADNVLKHGAGGLNIDGCRVETKEELRRKEGRWPTNLVYGQIKPVNAFDLHPDGIPGRWPPNMLLVHAPDCGAECIDGCPVAELDRQSGDSTSTPCTKNRGATTGLGMGHHGSDKHSGYAPYADSGGLSRMFPQFNWEAELSAPFEYHPKPSTEERDAGTEHLAQRRRDESRKPGSAGEDTAYLPRGTSRGNCHPTVKPISAMRWLCRLVCRRGGVVLDPFMGSGTTGIAALQEDIDFVGIEREAEYFAIAQARIRWWAGRHQMSMF